MRRLLPTLRVRKADRFESRPHQAWIVMRSNAEAPRRATRHVALRGACEVDERADSNGRDLAACVGPRLDRLAIGMRRLTCFAAHRQRPLRPGESIDAGQSARLEDVIVQGPAQ